MIFALLYAGCEPLLIDFGGKANLTEQPGDSAATDTANDTGFDSSNAPDSALETGESTDTSAADTGDTDPPVEPVVVDAETDAWWRIVGDDEGDQIGNGGVHGHHDLDNDGAPDILLAAPDYGQDERGAIALFSSLNAGPNMEFSDGLRLFGDDDDDRLGSSLLIVPDADRDGYDEVLVGATGHRGRDGTGRVYVFGWDKVRDGAAVNDIESTQLDGDGEDGAFGAALAAGDFDGDGELDLAVGASGERGGRGRVHLRLGGIRNWDSNRDGQDEEDEGGPPNQGKIHGSANGDALGTAVWLSADLTGDGLSDLVACSPGYSEPNDSAGACWIVAGESDADLHDPDVADVAIAVVRGLSSGDRTGRLSSSVAADDFDGDGQADLAVGASGFDGAAADGGAVAVALGPLRGTLSIDSGWFFQGLGGLGSGVGTVNLVPEAVLPALWASAPEEAVGGAIHILYPDYFATAGTLGTDAQLSIFGSAANDGFGSAAHAATDLNADGKADVVVAAPRASPQGSESGAVYVFPAF